MAESVRHSEAISLVCMCVVHSKLQFWTFHSGKKTCVLLMIVRHGQNTKHSKWEMLYEF